MTDNAAWDRYAEELAMAIARQPSRSVEWIAEMAEQQDAKRAEPKTPAYEWYEPIVAIRRDRISIGDGSRIDSFVKLEGGEGMTIGRHVHVASFCHLGIGGGTLVIEDGVALSSGAKVITGSNSPEGVSISASAPRDQQVVYRYTTRLCRNSAIFSGGIVLPGVTVGEGAVVAAGAVVTRDVPPFEVWAGVPAKRIGYRPGHAPEGQP